MSKIYNLYLELKELDNDPLYLFKSGKFYIFIAEDADRINEYVVLKQTKFTNTVNKCGFPDNSYEQYMKVFKNHNLNIVEVDTKNLVEPSKPSKIQEESLNKYYKIKNKLLNLNINEITPIEALHILIEIKELI